MTELPKTTDFLIIGGGIIGLCIARELKTRFMDSTVVLIEKESEPGLHASGRNSGVLHAGFYYTSDSLKARFCREGNAALTEFCLEHGLSINRCGKLVVTRNESELKALAELFQRGQLNGVELTEFDEQQVKELEPQARTVHKALYSPSTSTVSPHEVMTRLHQLAREEGIRIINHTAYMSNQQGLVKTTQGEIVANYVVNAAGLYADKIARSFGFSQDYTILPFKGLYLYAHPTRLSLNTNIYPVPDLNNPFLGVHFTVTTDNKIKIGPTAIPAFWRENYQGLGQFNLDECKEILSLESRLLFKNSFGFRNLAVTECRKFSKNRLVKLASALVPGLDIKQFDDWGKSGIRAQLVNRQTSQLEMDFKYEGDDRSLHILNAVSPAFTCSMPFSRYLVDEIETRL